MTLDKKVHQELAFPTRMSWDLAEKWADEIPIYSENDPLDPEWTATPIVELDLTKEGYGQVHVKDESHNPTRTHKDRPAWEIACLYRDFARSLVMDRKSIDSIEAYLIPRFTVMTAGNEGLAYAERFREHGLPPVKLLINGEIPHARINMLLANYADVYQIESTADPLDGEHIKKLTNNPHGIDITSNRLIEVGTILYDWLVHEVFNESPDEIYVPYGSGRLLENFVFWQKRNLQLLYRSHDPDPRLSVSGELLQKMRILGAEPREVRSGADMLSAPIKPHLILRPSEFQTGSLLRLTPSQTNIYAVDESYFIQAQRTLEEAGFCSSQSGAAGLALYMQRIDLGEIISGQKRIIVNTGRGI